MRRTSLKSADGIALRLPCSPLALGMKYCGRAIADPAWFNWCVSPIKAEGCYHLFSARWRGEMDNWGAQGQIIHSVAEKPEGPYRLRRVVVSDPGLLRYCNEAQTHGVISVLPGRAPHNCRIKKIGDQYALTFILRTELQNCGSQKIALLISESVHGPWRWAGGVSGFVVQPQTDPMHWTYNSCIGTDNHDIIEIDGEYRIYFKAGPRQDASMHYGYARAVRPEGPYIVCDTPALSENKNYIEDATVFLWNNAVYLLTTDNFGDNIGMLGYGVLWKSKDRGKTFRYADASIGFGLAKDYIDWPVAGMTDVYNGHMAKFERPALLMDDEGSPAYFFGALGMNLDGYPAVQSHVLKLGFEP